MFAANTTPLLAPPVVGKVYTVSAVKGLSALATVPRFTALIETPISPANVRLVVLKSKYIEHSVNFIAFPAPGAATRVLLAPFNANHSALVTLIVLVVTPTPALITEPIVNFLVGLIGDPEVVF